jgi:hypothetical protein
LSGERADRFGAIAAGWADIRSSGSGADAGHGAECLPQARPVRKRAAAFPAESGRSTGSPAIGAPAAPAAAWPPAPAARSRDLQACVCILSCPSAAAVYGIWQASLRFHARIWPSIIKFTVGQIQCALGRWWNSSHSLAQARASASAEASATRRRASSER